MVKVVAILGMGDLPALIGILISWGPINPYYWVDKFIPYYMEMSSELIDPIAQLVPSLGVVVKSITQVISSDSECVRTSSTPHRSTKKTQQGGGQEPKTVHSGNLTARWLENGGPGLLKMYVVHVFRCVEPFALSGGWLKT